jgi:hypothetical protein
MGDTIRTVIAIIGVFICLPVFLLLAWKWLTRPSKRKLEEYSREFMHRLQNPDFAAVEKHFGHPLPDCLRALYHNTQELMRDNFEVAASADAPAEKRWFIAFYEPADAQAVQDTWPGLEKYFVFADDGSGNGYVIDPKETDPAVLFHDHETGEISPVCKHFSDFMKWPRLEVPL